MTRSSNSEALEQRVYSVEKGQTSLGERIDAFAAGMDARIDRLTNTIEKRFSEAAIARQPQWGAFSLIAAVSIFVLSSFGALSVAFIQGQITVVDAKTIDNRNSIKEFVPRVELEGWQRTADDRDNRITQSLMQLRQDSVSQAEHTALLDRVNKTEIAIGNITPSGSVIQDMLDRLKRLEERPFRGNWNSMQPQQQQQSSGANSQ